MTLSTWPVMYPVKTVNSSGIYYEVRYAKRKWTMQGWHQNREKGTSPRNIQNNAFIQWDCLPTCKCIVTVGL